MSVARVVQSACIASALSVVSVPAAFAAYLGPGAWLGEFTPGGGFVQEPEVEGHTGADLTMIGGWEGGPAGPFTFATLDSIMGHATTVQWNYTGVSPLDLYLSVKYDGVYSIYHYPIVNAADFGIFSSDDDDAGVAIKQKTNGQPFNLDQVRLWAAASVTPIPVPPALLLLGTAVASLFGLRRGRRMPAHKPA